MHWSIIHSGVLFLVKQPCRLVIKPVTLCSAANHPIRKGIVWHHRSLLQLLIVFRNLFRAYFHRRLHCNSIANRISGQLGNVVQVNSRLLHLSWAMCISLRWKSIINGCGGGEVLFLAVFICYIGVLLNECRSLIPARRCDLWFARKG